MTTIQRFVSSIASLFCLALLAMAADEAKTTITATPSVFYPHECSSTLSAISPDGKYVVYAPFRKDPAPHEIRVCDSTTKKVIHTFHGGMLGAAFTPDSSRLICHCVHRSPNGSWAAPQIDVHDVKTWKRLREIPLKAGQPGGGGDGHGCPPLFALNNDVVVLSGKNKVATVYDLRTGKVLGDLPGKHRAVSLALSRDGRWLLTVDNKNVLHTWDVKARKHDRMLYEHISYVESIAISHDGRWCAFGTSRGIKVFDRTTGGEKAEGRTDLVRPSAMQFTSDGKRIIAAVGTRMLMPDQLDWGLRFWDWQTEDPPTSVISPITPEDTKTWRGKGIFHPWMMTSDGNRFFSVRGGQGRMLLDLKNPNPPPEKKPEPKKDPPKKP